MHRLSPGFAPRITGQDLPATCQPVKRGAACCLCTYLEMEDCRCHERRRGTSPCHPSSTFYNRRLPPTQTSITIDDIIYVIDTGKVKETQYDPESGLTKLVEQWITRAAGRQRRGRAGRTRPGVCYKLYTRQRESKMEQFPRPEIMRVPLESICLTVKSTREKEDVKVSNLNRLLSPASDTSFS